MDYLNRMRSEAGGAALDMASAQAQLANKAATVAAIEKGNQELITTMMARNLTITLLVDLYRLIHETLRRYSDRPYLARIAGQAVPVVPRDWPARSGSRCGPGSAQP